MYPGRRRYHVIVALIPWKLGRAAFASQHGENGVCPILVLVSG